MHSLISKSTIQKKSKEFGFDIIKITDPKIHKKNQHYIKDFLKNDFHGDMDWLEKNLERRVSPKNYGQMLKVSLSLELIMALIMTRCKILKIKK